MMNLNTDLQNIFFSLVPNKFPHDIKATHLNQISQESSTAQYSRGQPEIFLAAKFA